MLFGGDMRTHDAGHAALVGDGKGRVAELLCARHEFLRLARSSKEGEVADAAQLCVVGNSGHDCVASSECPMKEPRRLFIGEPRLEDPEHAGVLAQCHPVVAKNVSGLGLTVDHRAVPPTAFDAVRACQQDEYALIERTVRTCRQPERFRQHECRLRNIDGTTQLAWPRLGRWLPVAHPLDAMILGDDGPKNLVGSEPRGDPLKHQC